MGQFDTFDDIIGVLRRRFALILGITLIGAAVSIFYSSTLPRVYETSATIQIELPNVTGTAPGQSTGSRAKYRLNLIKQQLMARGNLIAVVDALDLFADTDLTSLEKMEGLRQAVSINQIIDAADAWRPDSVPSGLLIQVRLGNPEDAALTANTFLDRILSQSEERRQDQASQALFFFESEAIRVDAKISLLEGTIAEFKEANADSMPAGISALRDQLASLKETELEIERQIIGLKSNSGRVREDVRNQQIFELEEQNQLVADRIQIIQTALSAAPQVERDFSRLSRELDQLKEQLSVITRRRAEAEMGSMLESSQQTERFEILEAALVPLYPVSPNRKKIIIAGTALFLILGAGIAIFLELLNPSIRTPAQLERAMGIVPIVSIPVIQGDRRIPKGKLAWIIALLLGIGAVAWLIIQRISEFVGSLMTRRIDTRPRRAARF